MHRRDLIAVLSLSAGLLSAGFVPAVSGADAPDSLRLDATYDVSASLQWSNRRLVVSSTATVTNTTAAPVSALTFNLVPAKIGAMSLNGVTVDGSAASASVDDMNVIVRLPTSLAPNAHTDVTIRYAARFTYANPNRKWLFGLRDNIATAYRWIPWLSNRYPLHTPLFGDGFATGISREVRVSLTSDRAGMIYAAPGTRVSVNGATQTFVAYNVRDFNFTASPNYRVTTESHAGVQFEYYTIDLPQGTLARYAKAAFDKFSSLVGRYPYSRMVIAESNPGWAIESPQGFWIPNINPIGNLPYAVTHEVGHQWFYAVVGSDQAKEPFADEALVEFLTRTMFGNRGSKCALDRLDLSVYDYSDECYYEVIYIQGTNYLNAYRRRVGESSFWAGLRLYYQRYSFKMGGTKQLLSTLDEAAGGAGGGHHARFPSLFPVGG